MPFRYRIDQCLIKNTVGCHIAYDVYIQRKKLNWSPTNNDTYLYPWNLYLKILRLHNICLQQTFFPKTQLRSYFDLSCAWQTHTVRPPPFTLLETATSLVRCCSGSTRISFDPSQPLAEIIMTPEKVGTKATSGGWDRCPVHPKFHAYAYTRHWPTGVLAQRSSYAPLCFDWRCLGRDCRMPHTAWQNVKNAAAPESVTYPGHGDMQSKSRVSGWSRAPSLFRGIDVRAQFTARTWRHTWSWGLHPLPADGRGTMPPPTNTLGAGRAPDQETWHLSDS